MSIRTLSLEEVIDIIDHELFMLLSDLEEEERVALRKEKDYYTLGGLFKNTKKNLVGFTIPGFNYFLNDDDGKLLRKSNSGIIIISNKLFTRKFCEHFPRLVDEWLDYLKGIEEQEKNEKKEHEKPLKNEVFNEDAIGTINQMLASFGLTSRSRKR